MTNHCSTRCGSKDAVSICYVERYGLGLPQHLSLSYVGIIQRERIQRAAEAYSDYLTAIAGTQCEAIDRAKARIAAHGSRDAVAAVAAFTECSPCSSAETQNLLVNAVEAIQDHMRPFSEATAEKGDIRKIFCATR